MGFAIHWHESVMDLCVFPIPIPPPTSISTQSLWVFPVHQPWALVSCIQSRLVICFTLDNIHVSMLFSQSIPPLPSPTESKILFCTSVSLIFLKRSLVFPFLLFPSVSLHCLLKGAFLSLLSILWNSAFRWIYLFFSLLGFASLLFSAICKVFSVNHFAF